VRQPFVLAEVLGPGGNDERFDVPICSLHIPEDTQMGKADFLCFVVVLAKISSGVKEFFRSDAGHDAHGVPAEEDGFARGADSCRLFLQGIFERTARGVDSAISIFERPPHIDGNARVGKRIEHTYLLDIPNKEHTRR